MNIGHLARRITQFAVDNSPAILTTIGVAGTITTAYLAARASFEAANIIYLKETHDEQRGVVLIDRKEVLRQQVELTWRLYVPAVAVGCATIACVIGANRLSARRAAGLAAAYSLVERSAEEYRTKVLERIGERKEEEIRADVLKERLGQHDWEDDSIEIHGKPEGQVFHDLFSDRYVYTTHEEIRARVNDLNRGVVSIGYATLADFYYLMDMPAPSWSNDLGWNSDDPLMEVRFSSSLTPAGQPVHSFEFDTKPTPRYQRFH